MSGSKELVFYYYPSSFYSQKAYTALEEKGLPYTKKTVLLPAAETTAPWYMRINSNGTVPALLHGDKILDDSQKIIEYLEEAFPDAPRLIPTTPAEYRATVIHCQQRLDTLRIDLITFGSFANPHLTKNSQMPEFVRKRLAGRLGQMLNTDTLKAFAEANPDLREAYAKKIQVAEERAGIKLSPELVEGHINHAANVLREMDGLLEENKKAGHADYWLCGPDYTEADLILAITLQRFYAVGFAHVWQEGDMPNMDKYFHRVQQRPSFQKVSVNAMGKRIILRYLFGSNAKYVEGLLVLGAMGLVAGAGHLLYSSFLK